MIGGRVGPKYVTMFTKMKQFDLNNVPPFFSQWEESTLIPLELIIVVEYLYLPRLNLKVHFTRIPKWFVCTLDGDMHSSGLLITKMNTNNHNLCFGKHCISEVALSWLAWEKEVCPRVRKFHSHFLLIVAWTFNMKFTILTNFWVYNIVLLTIGIICTADLYSLCGTET